VPVFHFLMFSIENLTGHGFKHGLEIKPLPEKNKGMWLVRPFF